MAVMCSVTGNKGKGLEWIGRSAGKDFYRNSQVGRLAVDFY